MYRRRISGWLKHWDFILLDFLCLHLSFILAYQIRLGSLWPYGDDEYLILTVIMSGLSILEFAFFRSLSNVLRRGALKELAETAKHVILVLAAVTLYLFSVKSSAAYSRIFIYLSTGIYLALSYVTRLMLKHRPFRNRPRSMYIITTSELAEDTVRILKSDQTFRAFEISGLCAIDDCPLEKPIEGVHVDQLQKNELLHKLAQEWTDEVFLNLPPEMVGVRELKDQILSMGIALHVPVKARAGSHMEQVVENIGGYTVLTTSIKNATTMELVLKRCLDIFGGLVGCFFTLLICAVIAPIMKKQSPGPLFFKQERIGLNGKRFKMYKIRSMVMNADELKKDLMSKNRVSDGMMFKLDWDPRIIGNRELPDGTRKTGIGEFIRKTSLDEFPQFFNVLKGEMSLVGTRPPTVDEWEKYDLHHRARMATKPGITGMWQVSGRSDITDFEEVVRLDTEYIYNWSIGMDIRILLKTVKSVLKHDGAM